MIRYVIICTSVIWSTLLSCYLSLSAEILKLSKMIVRIFTYGSILFSGTTHSLYPPLKEGEDFTSSKYPLERGFRGV